MPKRISRKLLVGLGSIVTFGAVGTVSGFGIKSIIDSSLNNSKLNQLNFNTSDSGTVNDLPNYNVATEDMFIKTKNLKRFHFGNTQIGQKITPWGWLGVFDDDNGVKSRIALTSWNGEIIWVNEDHKEDKQYNVYDMQYDFNSNMLFVLRTDSTNGFYKANNDYPKVWLEVLDAKTGKRHNDLISDTDFRKLQEKAKDKLIDDSSLLYQYDSNTILQQKTKNLYYLDLTYSPQKKEILATWMPNYMQMARQTYKGTDVGSLPSFWDVINTWDEAATSFIFNEDSLNSEQSGGKRTRNFKLEKSKGIDVNKDSQGKIGTITINENQNTLTSPKVDASKIFLLTNPFFTTSGDGNAFVMHLIGANPENNRVYHKTIGWKIDSTNTEGEIYEVPNAGLTERKRYDNIEFWTGGGGYFNLKTDQSWTKAKGWNPAFINANLRVNKNMFDENSIVFAYPYSSSADVVSNSTSEIYGNHDKAMPVFNVVQILLNRNNAQFTTNKADNQKSNFNYDFGKQVDDYYITNKDSYGKNPSINSIYPYPSFDSFDEKNVNHSYNRLISVSPFDNTIIYAAKPNVGEPIFSAANSGNKDKWAGFWVINSWAWRWNKWHRYYHPLIIGNDQSIPLAADRYNQDEMNYMLSNINDLYRDGFTFDIRSLVDADWRTSLNLYFNQTGSGVNDNYNINQGFQSSKIGLLKDVLYQTRSNDPSHPDRIAWVNNVTSLYEGAWNDQAKKFLATTINKDSFSSIIHSRADLKKWYPRTWANANFPSNMLKAEEIFSINSQSTFAVADKFDTKLSGAAFNGKESIDLVTAWKDKGEDNAKYNNRFNRLIMKRPKIQADRKSQKNGLGLVTKYELSSDVYRQVVYKEGWQISQNTAANLTLTKVDTVENTSKQILSAWGDSYKMKKIAAKTSEINQNNTDWKEEVVVKEVLDRKDDAAIRFGNGNNNNIERNGAKALRLMLRIIKPSGNNLPDWFNNLSLDFFNRSYPLEAAFSGETTFAEVIKAFANERARLIDLSQDNNNVPVGLGNLKIDAYLELNPKFASYTDKTGKIYSVPGGKGIVDKSSANKDQLIIYKDNSSLARTIYDQTAIDYTSFNGGGFGATTESSWTNQNELNGLKTIKVTTDYNNLTNTLVRTSKKSGAPVFSFNYKRDDRTKIEIVPKDKTWFKNHFENFNRLLNLFVQFEYETDINGNNWKSLGTFLTDQDIKQKMNSNGILTLDSQSIFNIQKLRFKLTAKSENDTDSNLSIDIKNFNGQDEKYISDPGVIGTQTIRIDKSLIDNTLLTNQTKLLKDLNETDLNNYIKTVIKKLPDAANLNEQQIDVLLTKMTLRFDYGNKTNLDVQELLNAIKEKQSGVEPFTLWNGQNGEKIIAKFTLLVNDGSIQFVKPDWNPAVADDLMSTIKTDLKNEINIGNYIEQLQNKPLIVKTPPTVVGQFNPDATTINFPANSINTGFFASMEFQEIKEKLLSNLGVKVRFKGYDPNTHQFGNWTYDLNTIQNYDPANPQIIIGFEQLQDWNTKLVKNNQEINSTDEFSIKLALPKLITITDQVVNVFKADHGISGNTKKLIYSQDKINKLISDIKKDAANQSVQGIEQAPLEILFRLGGDNDNTNFLPIQELQSTLAGKNSDWNNNTIKFKIKISDGNDDKWVLNINDPTYTLLNDGNSVVPIFVHDANIWEEVNNGTIISGTNQQLRWSFPTNKGFTIENDDTFSSSSSKGKGLKLQFTTDKNLDVNTDQGWQSRITNVPLGTEAILIRIIAQNNQYVYQKTAENQNKKIQINLDQIREQINIDSTWLKQQFINNPTDIKDAITVNNLTNYENLVINSINSLNESTKKKIIIKYGFNNSTNANDFVDKNQLVNLVKQYQNSASFNILQLWNGTQGTKIVVKFFKADENGLYDFIYPGGDPEQQDLDTSKVTTTIEFDKVIKWLTNPATKMPVTKIANNKIQINIPNTNIADDVTFNNKSWTNIESVLKSFGIIIQYRPLLKSNQNNPDQDWVDNLSDVNQYDETIGKFQIRFKFDNQKASNIKLKLESNLTIDGTSNTPSKAFDVQLKITLKVKINNDFVFQGFISKPNVISGDTKILKIDQNLENSMVQNIKNENANNNIAFNNLNLEVRYQLGDAQVGGKWLTRNEFIESLASANNDQSTNKVVFKFTINQDQINDFSVDENFYTLSDYKGPNDPDLKIKYFINKDNWENNADNVTVQGTNSNLVWNFEQAFGNNKVEIKNDGTVYLKNSVGNAMQLQFSAKTNPSYQDQDVSDNLNELNTKWITKRPANIAANINQIKMRIVPLAGFIYEPANLSNSDQARIHNINFEIKTEIKVNKIWLKNNPLSSAKVEIKNLNEVLINQWENLIYQQIKTENNINDQIAKKVKIKFIIENDPNKYEAIQLVNKINELRQQFDQDHLGIVQLWNGTQGLKLSAIFESSDANFILKVDGINGTPTESDLKEQLQTNNIFTNISVSQYLKVLKLEKTQVDLDVASGQGKIKTFTPPNGKNPGGMFDRKTYDEIAKRLKEVGIKIEFAKNSKGPWMLKEAVKEYDIQLNSLYIAFTVESSNIELELDDNGTKISQNQDSKGTEIRLPLQVPKYILIDNTKNYWQNIKTQFDFRGNTKNIEFNLEQINNFVKAIKDDNATAGNDQSYQNAPLEILFQVGTGSEFKEINELKNYLSNQVNDDMPDRIIKIKFRIAQGQEENWKLQDPNVEYQFLNDNDQEINKIKIYINDKNVFNQLKSMQLSGTNEKLVWPWPSLVENIIDENTGILNPDLVNNFGKGLKFEFTFNPNYQVANTGLDPETEWVAKVPKSYDANKGFKNVYLRIKLTDENLYFYEFKDRVITLSLDKITQRIILKSTWLNKQLREGSEFSIDDLSVNDFTNLETKIKEQAKNDGFANDLLDKFTLRYNFNDLATNDNQWFDASELIEKINQFKSNYNGNTWGILQLWNGNAGINLNVKFVDAITNDKYSIDVDGNNNHLINNSNVITTIDFSKVINWISNHQNRIPFDPDSAIENGIKKIKIPNPNLNDDNHFNNRSWSDVESTLSLFGITIKYSEDIIGQPENFGALNIVKKYDPSRGLFKLKLSFDNTKATNIKLKFDNTSTYNGKTDSESKVISIRLDTKLIFKINEALVTKFINEAQISGDTKNIALDNQKETELINAIKTENEKLSPEFNGAPLILQYYLGDETTAQENDWKTADQFKQYLIDQANKNIDQTSNKLSIRFNIDQSGLSKFDVSKTPRILSAYQAPDINQSIKIKYFINTNKWEDNADKIEVGGTNDDLVWNLEKAFGQSVVIEKGNDKNNKKVYLKTVAGEGLQLHFIVDDNNQYTYDNPSGSTEDLAQIKSQWVTKKPPGVMAGTKILKVKLVATNNNFVYQAQKEKTAQAHLTKLNIQNKILVNKNWFKLNPLSTSELDISALINNPQIFEKWEQTIYQKIQDANSIDLATAKKIKIKYILEGNNDKNTVEELNAYISGLRSDFDGIHLGIVQLWNGTQGLKLQAIFTTDDPDYLLKPEGSQNNNVSDDDLKELVNTDNIFTNISMVEYINFLNSTLTDVEIPANATPGVIDSFTPRPMTGAAGQGFLYGKSFSEIQSRLNDLGVSLKFAKEETGPWNDKDQIKSYNIQKNSIFMAFVINARNIKIQLSAQEQIGPNQDNKNKPIRLKLQVPKYIIIDESKPYWSLTSDFNFSGNTKNISFDKNKINEFLTKIKDDNFNNSSGDEAYKNAPLKILFRVGTNTDFTDFNSLEDYLFKNPDDVNNRSVTFKFEIAKGQENDWKLQTTKSEFTLLTDTDQNNLLKIFINDKGYEQQGKELIAIGATDDFEIKGKDDWISKKPNGLNIWWSAETNPDETNDNQWSQTIPTKLSSQNPKLWFRFKTDPNYVYEKAIKNGDQYTEYSNKQSINISQLRIILNLQSEWLKKIKITGHTKTAQIDEQAVINEIINSAILPPDKPDLILLKYQIKGTDEWLTKNEFIQKLNDLSGSQDLNHFILKRENLEVRFSLNDNTNTYALKIDNQNITEENQSNFDLVMVNDQEQLNSNFEGYININKLKDFIESSFKIEGTTSKPKFIILKRQELNTAFVPYISDNLFDIQYSTKYDSAKNEWIWDTNQSILKNGQLIAEDGLIGNTQISADKKFALRFISKNSKYNVYKDDAKQTDGYILDISKNVKITIEITNPFSIANKTLGIWTRDGNTGKYYQGQGGFKIVVANKNDFKVDPNSIQSAQMFLNQSSLLDNEKNALEFVFHNFGSSASPEEIERVKKAINNYNDKETWKSFDSIKLRENDDWSNPIGLKVGDYLAVAMRVKEQNATPDESFVLKDNDFSMILPVMNDSNGIEQKPGRISGYKINTDLIKIQKGSITLSNMISSELPPLDGWTELQQLNLTKDDLGNYLGVDLKLELYSEFYEKNGTVLISSSGSKLIKRQSSGDGIVETGTYTDGAGKPITDPTTGKPIKIYKDSGTDRLSKPIKNSNATREKKLDQLGDGIFRLAKFSNENDRAKFSLFRNQDIDLKIEANIGEGTTNLPDFYLDQENKLLDIKDEVSEQIKFLVENENKISYAWNYDDFAANKIEYKHPSNISGKKPEDGLAQINTKFELIKKENGKEPQIITGTTIEDAVDKIQKQLDTDFGKQLKFQISYFNSKGSRVDSDGNNIYQFKELKNKDRIVLKIVAVADDLFYVNQEQPLIINVNGLTQAAPNADKLQYLRVKQGGVIDGQGSFKILVSNPNNPEEDERQILKGWKFLIRVWDKSAEIDAKTNQRKIKIDWTDDQARIKNLANGDRVEWKLVSEEGNPVKEAYYNTIALEHEQNSDGSINYKFAQVNYPAGDGTYSVVKPGVGDYPDDETKYPEDSGVVISGLKSAVDIFQISKDNFAKVMQQLNPTYVGINKQGTIKMEPKYFEDKYWVNNEGELFVKDQQATLKAQDQEQTKKEILLTEFLDNVTFYTHDPVLANYQGGFKFSDNDVNNNNHLTNGDKVWATFDMLNENDENIIINGNEIISSVTLQLADVSGLKEVIDPMSPLWYVLMALAGVVTLGTAALIAFLMTRHKKLKGK